MTTKVDNRAERDAIEKAFPNKCIEIVDALNKVSDGNWKIKDDDSSPFWGKFVIAADGRKLFLKVDAYKQMMEISAFDGVVDIEDNHHDLPPADRVYAKVAFSKTPDKIASDIVKRVLPKYNDGFNKCKEAANLSNEYYQKKYAIIDQLKSVLKPNSYKISNKFGSSKKSDQYIHIKMDQGDGFYGDIIPSSDSVSIELSGLSIEQTKTVLKALCH